MGDVVWILRWRERLLEEATRYDSSSQSLFRHDASKHFEFEGSPARKTPEGPGADRRGGRDPAKWSDPDRSTSRGV